MANRALGDFKEAAQRNYPFAFNNIGRAYETGEGVVKDPKKAAALYVETFNRVSACCAAPVMSELLAAKDIGRDDARRVALLILDWAGTLGDPVAQHDLAEDFLVGTLKPPDGRAAQAEAYRHFRLAEKLFGEQGNVEDAQAAAHKAQELAAKLAPTAITGLDAEIAGWTKQPFTADPPWLAVAFAKR